MTDFNCANAKFSKVRISCSYILWDSKSLWFWNVKKKQALWTFIWHFMDQMMNQEGNLQINQLLK